MDYSDYKDAVINTTEKRARHFLDTGRVEGDFGCAFMRAIDNEGFLRVAALILCDAPKGDIRAALESAMFSDKYIERECERMDALAEESRSESRRFDAEV